MTQPFEELIIKLRASKKSGNLIVPLIEEFLVKPAEIDDKADRDYVRKLVFTRSQKRKKGVYSPSMLASCVRQVYFTKTGMPPSSVSRVESSGIFLDGNWRHFKWQFVLWKMHREGIIQLIGNEHDERLSLGAEIRVSNEAGDYQGTLDNLIYIPDLDWLGTLDYKGMNGNSFNSARSKGPGMKYIMQSVGYGLLANDDPRLSLPKKLEEVIIIGENKNGPIPGKQHSPLGLIEWRYNVNTYRQELSQRVKTLRAYERKGETPQIECVSTQRLMFKQCPFNKHCKAEVEAVAKRNRLSKAPKNYSYEKGRVKSASTRKRT